MLSVKHARVAMLYYRIAKRRGEDVAPIPDAPHFDSEIDARKWTEEHPDLIVNGQEAFVVQLISDEPLPHT
jgi:hypothetical protein